MGNSNKEIKAPGTEIVGDAEQIGVQKNTADPYGLEILECVENDDDTLVIDNESTIGRLLDDPGKAIADRAAKAYETIKEDAAEVHLRLSDLDNLYDNSENNAYERDTDVLSDVTLGKGGSRLVYMLAWIIAVISGTATGVIGAIALSAGRLFDGSGYSEHYLEYMSDSAWYGKITGAHAQADYVSHGLLWMALAGVIFLASIIVLCVLTGRFSLNEEGKAKLNWFDRRWTEVQLFIAVCASCGAVAIAYPIWTLAPLMGWYKFFTPYNPNDYFLDASNDLIVGLCIAGMAVCIAAAVVLLVSMVKKIKTRQLIEKSLLGILLGWLGIGAKYAGQGAAIAGRGLGDAIRSAGREIRGLSRVLTVPADTDKNAVIKIMAKYILIAACLIIFPLFIAVVTDSPEGTFICMVISIVLASLLIIRKVGKLAEIRAGVIEVKSGNLSHKITVNVDDKGPKTDLDKLASDINHISEATNAAVQNEIKNQRLKTDLISNVSHDLKTPLTSMISYLDILAQEGLDSPDAPAHLAIVQEKTERLKVLTEDLFEAAKASSGNIPCEITNIDIGSLIDQSLAEMGDRLSRKELKIRKSIKTDNTMVRADGKLLSRVFENLLGNISKYALEKSRVYIDVTEISSNAGSASGNASDHRDRLLIEFKNISKDELNISADELMERFTRGDSARNTEGSGLGLAIAKDLTTLMGGTFDISIDGDMFKASIVLNRA